MADPMTYELHPLCVLFPRMSPAEFNSLRDDIKAHGLRTPITLHDGLILDGGNRYEACVAAGVAPHFVQFDGDNIVSFVLSSNLHRRHMTAGQQAAIVATATDWGRAHKHGGDRRSEQGEALHLETVAQRAAVAGATTRTQKDADKLVREHPEKAKEVIAGKRSLYSAVQDTKPKIEKQTEAEQNAADAHGDFDPIAELEAANKEIATLIAQLDAVQADDVKAEALKWRRLHQVSERKQGELMDSAHRYQKDAKWVMDQLRRCGKAVGEDDPAKIARAVERAVARIAA